MSENKEIICASLIIITFNSIEWLSCNWIAAQSDFFTDFPLTHSVARELEAMAEPQPNVLNFASTILPFSSTLIWRIKHAHYNQHYIIVKTWSTRNIVQRLDKEARLYVWVMKWFSEFSQNVISWVTNYAYNRGLLTCLLYREKSRQTLPWQFCNFTCEIKHARQNKGVICHPWYWVMKHRGLLGRTG